VFDVNNEVQEVQKGYKPTLDAGNIKGCVMSIDFQIKKFFELPGILDETLDNMKTLQSQTKISQYVNSDSWKEKLQHFKSKIVIPIFFFLDGFEVINPLGSHSVVDNICGVYYTFPVIHQHFLSKLD